MSLIPEKASPSPLGSSCQHDVVLAPGIAIPFRDGVVSRADVYFPAQTVDRLSAPLPVILFRTPYDKCGAAGTGTFYAQRGYVFVAQDVRGRYASEGEFFAFADEGEDGVDTVAWLAAQPWCNGSVGTLGASYCAADQSALAALAPPALAAMIVQFGPSSYFHSSMRQNGALEMRFLVYAFSMAATSREAAADPGLKRVLTEASEHVWDYLAAGPIRAGATPLRLIPSYERWALEIQQRGTYDAFWQRPGFGPRPFYDSHADVPTLYVGGWYDTYTRGTLENFLALSELQTTAVHVLMGPWTHGGVGVGAAGDAAFGPQGSIDFEAVRLRWMDQWLKGLDVGLEDEKPVTYFLMGAGTAPPAGPGKIGKGGEWREASSWPPANSEEIRLRLRHGGALSLDLPTADEAQGTSFTFDPSLPVPTIGGSLSALPLPAGMFDQRNDARFPASGGNGVPLASRRDVLAFETAPFAADLDIVGPVTVDLYVSSDAPDTDFTAKLLEIIPPTSSCPSGVAANLTDGIARLRFRDGYDEEKLGEPGMVYRLTFELFPTASRIPEGHRLRLDVSSSNYPRFDVNPNTGGALGVEQRLRTAENTVHHSPECASCVVLSVLRGK
ncbi:MAG: CocE/NonD family hydrolase [Lentisphaerae bacterium]|jgi:uncharacterized protein|nr:CocE/NonD family hydrolase [Lentisphaerota bacterium]MBT4816640.1 CocE/NonD family hydrolase [Lentisphaerota bacterium]MBT5610059.1 CocE/NonD family hydrolase [Lentisphaerota bacterium]MBT7055541.1 CocE/NonD family hydrolase [Lentisphaerota bacterium]MBT7841504.1 CocE/NonD family hydrolase [Lentisphaerota bacterium]